MPWKDPAQRRAAQAAYRRTPAGKAAAQRSRDRFYAKRRGERDPAPLTINPAPLAQVLSAWRMQ
jgi:hypothetical protein